MKYVSVKKCGKCGVCPSCRFRYRVNLVARADRASIGARPSTEARKRAQAVRHLDREIARIEAS